VGCLFCVYVVLIFQTVLYAVLYNYFVCVFPGPGGLKRPFLFFLNVSCSPKLRSLYNNVNIPIMYSPTHTKNDSAMNIQRHRVAHMPSSSAISVKYSEQANVKHTLLTI